MTNVFLTRLDSPIGRIELVGDDDAVTALSIEREGALPHDGEPERSNDVLDAARAQLLEYFAGDSHRLRRAGAAHRHPVPAGRVGRARAARLGRSHLVRRARGRGRQARIGRAIGGAVGANPMPIIVGCHRVLASDGRITGYSGGDGVPTKLWLLGHERIGFAA